MPVPLLKHVASVRRSLASRRHQPILVDEDRTVKPDAMRTNPLLNITSKTNSGAAHSNAWRCCTMPVVQVPIVQAPVVQANAGGSGRRGISRAVRAACVVRQ